MLSETHCTALISFKKFGTRGIDRLLEYSSCLLIECGAIATVDEELCFQLLLLCDKSRLILEQERKQERCVRAPWISLSYSIHFSDVGVLHDLRSFIENQPIEYNQRSLDLPLASMWVLVCGMVSHLPFPTFCLVFVVAA